MGAPNGCIGKCCAIFHLEGKNPVQIVAEEPIETVTTWLANLEVLPSAFLQEDGQIWQAYKCKLQDEETKLCTFYDKRPIICRLFPVGPCPHEGCTVNPEPSIERDGPIDMTLYKGGGASNDEDI